jgi:DTW domain-containing protein YfiP
MTGVRTGRKTKEPCEVCFMHPERCLCAEIPQLDLKTRVCLVVHYRELRRTTNTGSLAVKALTNSELRVRGEDRAGLDLSDILTGNYRTVLFYPSDEAVDLNAEFVAADSRPIQLIVPDGNWRRCLG